MRTFFSATEYFQNNFTGHLIELRERLLWKKTLIFHEKTIRHRTLLQNAGFLGAAKRIEFFEEFIFLHTHLHQIQKGADKPEIPYLAILFLRMRKISLMEGDMEIVFIFISPTPMINVYH